LLLHPGSCDDVPLNVEIDLPLRRDVTAQSTFRFMQDLLYQRFLQDDPYDW